MADYHNSVKEVRASFAARPRRVPRFSTDGRIRSSSGASRCKPHGPIQLSMNQLCSAHQNSLPPNNDTGLSALITSEE